MIHIVTADRDSGKTTFLRSLVDESFGGILSLSDEGKDNYYAYDIESGEKRLLMSSCPIGESRIGRFYIAEDTFRWAEERVLSSLRKRIAIDEIGRLEVNGKGFHDALSHLIDIGDRDIYIAVRTSLVPDVIRAFRIGDYECIHVENRMKE
ncbi:MAG: nucleoside-triphosphatase [Candidatus Ornithospirochaeta sp.]|nr:nucleoside-triphosphatase [Candidatus Ornithospirochaeta sp.]